MFPVSYFLLVPLGFLVGAYGTLIGAGGGFLLVPLLILMYPDEKRTLIACISLAVVFVNAGSGSVAYARMKRIDYRSGLLFSATAVPGAVLGALSTAWLPRPVFDVTFASVMIATAVFLLLHPGAVERTLADGGAQGFQRTLTDAEGVSRSYSYSRARGLLLAFAVGYVSSLLGTGGGIIHVPAMIRFLAFPVHIATATSHFVLAITALAGTIVHIAEGTFTRGIWRTAFLSVGVLAGAQVGARLSTRIHGAWIVRGLAIALGLVGVRILLTVL
jgi:hypothetical protein